MLEKSSSMDNKKIGKLIADLRKQKGLTQQELGDKVSVGFRAVSKWERGITLPDITIINELSKILGISSDELLRGELNKENKPNKDKKKMSSKVKITLVLIITLIIIFASILSYYKNKTYTYTLESISDEYYIDGQMTYNKGEIILIINKIEFLDKELRKMIIQNYDYQIWSNGIFIFGLGNTDIISYYEKTMSIDEFTKSFRVNYKGATEYSKRELIKNGIIINLLFQDENNQTYEEKIEIKFSEKNN